MINVMSYFKMILSYATRRIAGVLCNEEYMRKALERAITELLNEF